MFDMLGSKGLRMASVSRVRRCLFGPVDHAEVSSQLKLEMKVLDEETKTRYNFDFATGMPLDGAYKWTPVNDCHFLPIPSKVPDLLKHFGNVECSEGKSFDVQRILKPQPHRLCEHPEHQEGGSCNMSLSRDETGRIQTKRKQSQITDFFPQKKQTKHDGDSSK